MNTIKLLYVEDDTDYAEMIRQRLAQEGFEVAIAPTATKAEKLFREFRPSLVLVDLDLQQEKEGLEVIRDIYRQSPYFPVIVYSAHVEPEMVIKTMEYGVLHHVGKERSIPELIAMLRNALKQTYRCEEIENPEYQLSPITTFNFSTRILTIHGTAVALTRIAGTLLQQLCLHINEFVQPEELTLVVWGYKKEVSELRRYISRLRKIIEPQDPGIRILNQSGGYYQLECESWKETMSPSDLSKK